MMRIAVTWNRTATAAKTAYNTRTNFASSSVDVACVQFAAVVLLVFILQCNRAGTKSSSDMCSSQRFIVQTTTQHGLLSSVPLDIGREYI